MPCIFLNRTPLPEAFGNPRYIAASSVDSIWFSSKINIHSEICILLIGCSGRPTKNAAAALHCSAIR